MSATASATDNAPESPASAIVPVVASDNARPRTSGTTKPASTGAHKDPPKEDHALSSAQKKRLDALQRLCNQGTYTPAECAAKRQAIIQGGP
jgi:hypothetical protein